MSPELAGGFLTTGPTGKPCNFFPVVDSSFTALWSEKVFYMILCFKMYQFNKIKIKCFGAYQAEEAEVDQFYEDIEDLLELKKSPKKRYSIHHWGLECKSRKSRCIWSNRQVWP